MTAADSPTSRRPAPEVVNAQVAADGLGFPEGPLILDDGRTAFVEMYRGQVSVLQDETVHQLAYLGGAPNGLALGPDGRIYVARPEGRVGSWMSPDPQPPAIVAVNPANGKHEVVAVEANGQKLRAPNDLCFGPDGALYFTDPCAVDPDGDFSAWICRLEGDRCEILHEIGNVFPNGIGFDPEGQLVWAETHTRRMVASTTNGRRTVVELGEGATPDGFAFTADGRCVIATVSSGGLDVVEWVDGSSRVDRLVWAKNVVPVNLAFDDRTLWVTDVTPDWSDPHSFTGRLWRLTTTELVGALLAAP